MFNCILRFFGLEDDTIRVNRRTSKLITEQPKNIKI